MSEEITVEFFGKDNKRNEKSIPKGNNFNDLLTNIKKIESNFITEYYDIFYLSDNNKEIYIDNEEEFVKFKEKKLYIHPKEQKLEAATSNTNKTELDNNNNDTEIKNLNKDEPSKDLLINKKEKYIEKLYTIIQNILEKIKEINKIIQSNSNQIDNIIKTLSNNSPEEKIDDINNIICKELDLIIKYINPKENKNSIIEKNNKEKINTDINNIKIHKTVIKTKKTNDIPPENKTTLKNKYIPYSCILGIEKEIKFDISYNIYGEE